MARKQLTDFLQVGRFHVIDVSFTLPPVLVPLFGFRTCTLPEVTANIKTITEGNSEYPRKVYSGAEIGDVTLTQGVSIFNSDFWDWMKKAIVGKKGPKNLLIVQFSRIGGETARGKGVIAGGLEFSARFPGRAWLIKGCRPSRYRPGSDFDAMSQDISLAELTLSIEEMEEYSLGI